jgi:hypothetical protein
LLSLGMERRSNLLREFPRLQASLRRASGNLHSGRRRRLWDEGVAAAEVRSALLRMTG